MITILHGEDAKTSRQVFTDYRQKGASITLEGSNLDVTTLTQSLGGDGLFDENKIVLIEQLLSKKKKSKELDSMITLLQSYPDKEIVLWEGKEIDRKLLAQFPKAQIRAFALPQLLFTFLDSIRPSHGAKLVSLYHQTLATVEPDMIFSMLVRQMRLLMGLMGPSQNPIEEVKRLAPWQQQKLKKQAQLFTETQLISLYNSLFRIDNEQKTGKASVPLSNAIDFWLLKL